MCDYGTMLFILNINPPTRHPGIQTGPCAGPQAATAG